jgi:hypothetical protein
MVSPADPPTALPLLPSVYIIASPFDRDGAKELAALLQGRGILARFDRVEPPEMVCTVVFLVSSHSMSERSALEELVSDRDIPLLLMLMEPDMEGWLSARLRTLPRLDCSSRDLAGVIAEVDARIRKDYRTLRDRLQPSLLVRTRNAMLAPWRNVLSWWRRRSNLSHRQVSRRVAMLPSASRPDLTRLFAHRRQASWFSGWRAGRQAPDADGGKRGELVDCSVFAPLVFRRGVPFASRLFSIPSAILPKL